MPDYPDGTYPVDIIAQDLAYLSVDVALQSLATLAVDITAQTLSEINVDITAQSVGNIAIDIAAQTIGNLAVNIAASAITLDINLKASDITLNVDISAQTIGNLTIDIEAQSVGVYLQPEWASKEGQSKTLIAIGVNKTWGGTTSVPYTPSGVTLYITDLTAYIYSSSPADAAKKGVITAWIATGALPGTKHSYIGGIGGFSHTFSNPIRITDGTLVTLRAITYTEVNADFTVIARGYEI